MSKPKNNILTTTKKLEFPPDLQEQFKKAKKLEWITFAYLISVIIIMYLALGSSQAMKVAWLEDLLSIVPAIAFLIAGKIFQKKPNDNYPYGYHRVFSIAFMMGSFALLGMGLFTIVDSSMALIKAEHPTIGSVNNFGKNIWMGWLMIAALLYSSIPSMILGYKKLPMAKKLHNKILYTDSQAQKADWLTSIAAISGIIGIGFGLWWADAVAALIISFDVTKDGFTQTKGAITDLMDQTPKEVKDDSNRDTLMEDLAALINKMDWVKDARVRMREHGHVYFGEIYIIPENQDNLVEKIEDVNKKARDLDWKIHDLSIMPVKKF